MENVNYFVNVKDIIALIVLAIVGLCIISLNIYDKIKRK